jgi:hypothetical protein
MALTGHDMTAVSAFRVEATAGANDVRGRFRLILLKKSFGGSERNFLGPLMRFMSSDVRDRVACQKIDHGASYRYCEGLKSWSRPEIKFRESFDAVRFSTFSTVSTHLGH